MRICKISDCERKHYGHGYCELHYDRMERGTPLHQEIRKTDGKQGCTVEGCERKHGSRGYCLFHYQRLRQETPLDQETQEKDGKQGCRITNCTAKHIAKGYCHAHWERVRTKRRKNKLVLQHGGKCYDCNNTFPSFVFDFDNISDSPGHTSVSKLIHMGATNDVIQKELERCQLVCANCHRIRTHSRYADEEEIQEYSRESE
ncbi:hypothetical protein LCGC14_0499370 [marine sediment metagenome]|uniref:HNH domain-containing protein n=1 Tax=marine sediment metagenome TaxID=412755 RepID=A0A0F9SMU5_9ZZZZ